MKKLIAICFVFCFALTTTAFANLVCVDLTGNNTSGTADANIGGLTTFERFNNPSTGTGVFDPFVRIQGNGTEKGYNTDGTPEFDTKPGTWTHSITLGALSVIDGKISFLLDINQEDNGDNRYLSLDALKIYLANSGSIDSYDSAVASGDLNLIYDLGNNWVKMDNTIFKSGSGTGDMRVSINKDSTLDNSKYLYLYSKFGSNFSSNDGFEEWSATVPEPATLCLLGLGALSLIRRKK